MPLINCPDCSKSISDAAPACIHCGRPVFSPGAIVEYQPSRPIAQIHEGGEAFRAAGWLLIVGGALGLVYFGVMDTTVATGGSQSFAIPDRVYNVGLMETRGIGLIGSALAAIAGIVCLGFGYSLRRPIMVKSPTAATRSVVANAGSNNEVHKHYILQCPACDNNERRGDADRFAFSSYTRFRIVERGFFRSKLLGSCCNVLSKAGSIPTG